MNKLGAFALAFAAAAAQPAMAQQKSTSAANQKQAKAPNKDEVGALRQENSELHRQLEEAGIQIEQLTDELDRLNATLRENQSGGDSLLKELQQTKAALAQSDSRAKSMEADLGALQDRARGTSTDGGFIAQLGPDVVPAVCLNLRRMAPKTKRVTGVVVVNVLISEIGEPLDVCLIQGLPGDESKWNAEAHEACLEAAKRLAFKPATTKDGSTRLKVWQGVGFYLY
jgi:DNA repair exonuclease SbcCD ATPase subunit